MLNVLLVFILLSVSVNAQTTYEIGIDKNDEFVWEITDLNLDKFEATFGSEPNFQVGSQVRMIIREVDDVLGLRWSIVVEFWDYGTDWSLEGSIEPISIQRYPSQYDDYIFIPTPVADYVEEAIETLPSQYYTYGGNIIGKQDVSDIGVNFKVEKAYNIDGVLTTETYLDEADLIIVKLDATFQFIPFGFSFLAFTSLTIVGMIIFLRQKKRISLVKT
ncbi:MAG: hypothetical protein EU533_04885 [Promethearchaeota archaeon]|nr:MAG: hypothetical protein EU533_04885 [Candidatus Lokiarchaeota archaeon]